MSRMRVTAFRHRGGPWTMFCGSLYMEIPKTMRANVQLREWIVIERKETRNTRFLINPEIIKLFSGLAETITITAGSNQINSRPIASISYKYSRLNTYAAYRQYLLFVASWFGFGLLSKFFGCIHFSNKHVVSPVYRSSHSSDLVLYSQHCR